MQTRRTRRFRPAVFPTSPAAPVHPAASAAFSPPDAGTIVRRRHRSGRRSALTAEASRAWRVMLLVVCAAAAFRPLDAFCQFVVEESHKAAVAIGFTRGGGEVAQARPLPWAEAVRARDIPATAGRTMVAAGPTRETAVGGGTFSRSFRNEAVNPYVRAADGVATPVFVPSGSLPLTGGQPPARAMAVRSHTAPTSGRVPAAAGGTFDWSGASTAATPASANWTTAGNWTGGTAPAPNGNADIVFTPTPATATTSTVDANYTINTLTFQAGTPAYTIDNANNAVLTINAGITDASANHETLFPVPVVLGAAQTWNVSDPNGFLEIRSGITGTGGLTKTGPGTLNLGGSQTPNAFGTLTVLAGTVQLDKDAGIAAIGGDLIIGNATNPGAAGSAVAQLNNPDQTTSGNNVILYADGRFDLANGSGNGTTDNFTTINNLTMTGGEVRLGAGHIALNGITTNASATSALISSTDSTDNLTSVGTTITTNVARGTATYDLDVQAGIGYCALVKNGAGVMRLAGTENDDFSVTLNAGTLALASDAALGTAVDANFNPTGPSTFTFAGGTVTADGGDRTIANPVALTGGATIGASLDGTPRAISFTGTTTLTGSQTLTVNNTAATTFAAVDLNGANTLTMAGTGNTTISGAITDESMGGSLVMSGAGTLTLTGANTYTGGTTFAAGVLNAGSAGALGGMGTLSFTGGTLQYSAANQTDYSPRFSSAANQRYSVDTNGQNVTFATGLTSSGGSLTKLGTGTLTLTGANTYTGLTYVAAGTLAVPAGGSIGAGSGGSKLLFIDGPTGGSAATLQISGGSVTAANSASYIGNTGTGIVSVTAGSLTTGDFQLGTNTTGQGTLNVSGTGSVSILGSLLIGATNGGSGTLTQSGGTTNVSVYLQIGGTNAGSGTLTQTGGNITATGVLNVGGSGGGTYNLSGGTMTVGGSGLNVGYLGTGLVLHTGGTLDATAGMESDIGLDAGSRGTYDLSETGVLETSALAVGSAGTGIFNQSGGQVFAGSYLKIGDVTGSTGTYNLNGGTLNTAQVVGGNGTSTFRFNGGTLQASASDHPGAASNPSTFFSGVTHAYVGTGGAVIDTNGFNVTVASTLTSDPANGTATDGGLFKYGDGTLTLTANSTYAGTTLVDYGALMVNNVPAKAGDSGTGSGPVYVGQGAWLGGTGAIGGSVTVGGYPPTNSRANGTQPRIAAGAGTLTPGVAVNGVSTPGRLTINGSLTFVSGTSVLEADIAGANPGTGYDQVVVGGNLALAGTLTLTLGTGFTPTPGEKFFLFEDTGNAAVSGTFDALPQGSVVTDSAGNEYVINYTDSAGDGTAGNDVSITFVPEPSTWAMLGLGAAVLGLARCRRSRARRA